MKSSKVGTHHIRRAKILNDLKDLPFNIFAVVIDKRDCKDYPGLQYKKSFYKFMNNIVHKELYNAFSNLTVVADEIGGSEYMQGFAKYVQDRQEIPDLFGEREFMFETSNISVLIQLADFISGSLAYKYDPKKKSNIDFYSIIKTKYISIMLYPKKFETYLLNSCAIAEDYDEVIAKLCFKQAAMFLEINKYSSDNEVKAQITVINYLLFRFMNNDTRGYISTKELKNQLSFVYEDYHNISTSTFRLRIICKLRDKGVIIASSPNGYKIPSKKTELYDFINHGASVVIPMLERLKKCRDLIKLGTANELDLFAHDEFTSLRKYFDEDIKNT